MGGYSSEYKISLKSGNVVYDALDKKGYNTYRIHIFKNKWVYVNDINEEFEIDKNDFSVVVNDTKITFDCVFNAIHGAPGEDGYMQAYFKLINMPQTWIPATNAKGEKIDQELVFFFGMEGC